MGLKQYVTEKIEKQKDLKMLEQYEKTYSAIAEQTKQLESDLFNFVRVKYPKLTEWLEQYLKDYQNFAVAVYKDKLLFKTNPSKRILDGFEFLDKQLETINIIDNNKVAEILSPNRYNKAKKEKALEQINQFLENKNKRIFVEYCDNKRTILKLGPTLNMENRPELFELFHTVQGLDSLLQDMMRKCKLTYDEYSKFYNDCLGKYMTLQKDSNGVAGYVLKGKHRISPYNDKWTASPEQVLLQKVNNLDPEAISAEAKAKVERLMSHTVM